jgi:crossover junction endodeoxyribonuclease RuvC
MRVMGIAPGLRHLGWGVISVEGSRITHVANGQCQGDGDTMGERLLALHSQLTQVLALHKPDAAAVEQVFVNTNGAGTLKLGQARGIAMLVPAQAGLSIGEYAPNTIKKSVVGVGHADKEQVQHMVRLQLPGVDLAGPDAADALAIALCHAHHLGSRMVIDQASAAGTGLKRRAATGKAGPKSWAQVNPSRKARA